MPHTDVMKLSPLSSSSLPLLYLTYIPAEAFILLAEGSSASGSMIVSSSQVSSSQLDFPTTELKYQSSLPSPPQLFIFSLLSSLLSTSFSGGATALPLSMKSCREMSCGASAAVSCTREAPFCDVAQCC